MSASSAATELSLVLPPMHLRSIVDKTAAFVARNGLSFEQRIMENERNNPKFSFLINTDPYRPYYDVKVAEYKKSPPADVTAPSSVTAASDHSRQPTPSVKSVSPEEATSPPPLLEFAQLSFSTSTAHAPNVSSEITPPPWMTFPDKDIISLTALFVSRNGRPFLLTLAEKEAKNPQFDFLKSSHPYFPFFSKMVEAYTKLMAPSANLILKIADHAKGPEKILQDAQKRASYKKHAQEQQKQAEKSVQAERDLFLSADWTNFSVVEWVTFPLDAWADAPETKNYPSPIELGHLCQLNVLQQRQLISTRMSLLNISPAQDHSSQKNQEEEEEMMIEDDEDEDSPHQDIQQPGKDTGLEESQEQKSKEDELASKVDVSLPLHLSPPPAAPSDDYIPRALAMKQQGQASDSSLFQICPRCNQRIPVADMPEHVRQELLDPKWKEQQTTYLSKTSDSNLLIEGSSMMGGQNQVSLHLQRLAKKRADIFGRNEEEERGEASIKEEGQSDGEKNLDVAGLVRPGPGFYPNLSKTFVKAAPGASAASSNVRHAINLPPPPLFAPTGMPSTPLSTYVPPPPPISTMMHSPPMPPLPAPPPFPSLPITSPGRLDSSGAIRLSHVPPPLTIPPFPFPPLPHDILMSEQQKKAKLDKGDANFVNIVINVTDGISCESPTIKIPVNASSLSTFTVGTLKEIIFSEKNVKVVPSKQKISSLYTMAVLKNTQTLSEIGVTDGYQFVLSLKERGGSKH